MYTHFSLFVLYNSSVRVYVTELLLNDWTDFDEILCVCSRGSENGLDSQFCPLDNSVSKTNGHMKKRDIYAQHHTCYFPKG
uniref:SFRICE_037927 n=1 Tax=Spodoptera frugiperda TaxID=7108 RepID=A0A2H1WBI2_SPOFR